MIVMLKSYLVHTQWQEFSSDMGSRTVKRIGDVSKLRIYQFPQVCACACVGVHAHARVYNLFLVTLE